MPRHLALIAILLAVGNVAHAVTKCRSADRILYQNGACPAGYTNVTAGMKANVTTIQRTAAVRQRDRDYGRVMAATARELEARRALDDRRERIALNDLWAQCQFMEFQIRLNERAMIEAPVWDDARRYRIGHRALTHGQYDLGCYG